MMVATHFFKLTTDVWKPGKAHDSAPFCACGLLQEQTSEDFRSKYELDAPGILFKKCQPNLQACMHKEGVFPSCRTFAICNLSLVAIFGAAFLKDVKNQKYQRHTFELNPLHLVWLSGMIPRFVFPTFCQLADQQRNAPPKISPIKTNT